MPAVLAAHLPTPRNPQRLRRVRGNVLTTSPKVLMRPLLCFLGLAVCPVLGVCQRPVPANLTLADAISLARANNPTYRQAIHNRARQQLQHEGEFLKLAQARSDVGRASLIDVRQAQVARGQAQVALLRARTAVQVEKLRLFQAIGVPAPVDIASVQLTDSFSVQTPTFQLTELLALAEQQNPPLKALRERESAARWGVRAAPTSYGPSLSLTAGWSGFTQKLSDLPPSLPAVGPNAPPNSPTCRYANSYWLHSRPPPLSSGIYATQ